MTTNPLSDAPELRTLFLGAERFVTPVEVDAESPTDDSSQLWYQLDTVDFERDIRA